MKNENGATVIKVEIIIASLSLLIIFFLRVYDETTQKSDEPKYCKRAIPVPCDGWNEAYYPAEMQDEARGRVFQGETPELEGDSL